MIIELPQQNQRKGRVNFNENDFRKLIEHNGIRLEWSKAAMCPCSLETAELDLDLTSVDYSFSASQAPSCPVCEGSGKLYHSTQTIKAVPANADTEFINARFGGYKDGLIQFSLNPEHLPAHGDRFRMLDSVLTFNEVIESYQGEDTTSLRFPVVRRQMTLTSGQVEIGVTYLTVTDPVTKLTVPDLELVEGTDFNVVDSRIEWVNKPASGSRLSVSYYANPSYICVGFPHSVRDSRGIFKDVSEYLIPLPIQIQAKLEFLDGE